MKRNHLTPQELRNFTRRARFTVCGEPADVFSEPAPYNGGVLFVTVNRNAQTGAVWLEATSHTYYEPTTEIGPEYLKACRKVNEQHAREVISRELRRWASMPAGTVTGWSPAQIVAEAERLANR